MSISPADFSGLEENLRSLSLSDNLLTEVGEVTFRRLARLRWLFLDGNRLTVLPVSSLPPSASLEELNLDRNLLRSFHEGILDEQPRLMSVSMEGNDMTSWPCEAVRGTTCSSDYCFEHLNLTTAKRLPPPWQGAWGIGTTPPPMPSTPLVTVTTTVLEQLPCVTTTSTLHLSPRLFAPTCAWAPPSVGGQVLLPIRGSAGFGPFRRMTAIGDGVRPHALLSSGKNEPYLFGFWPQLHAVLLVPTP